jgi:colanic acid biosynthesis glycosyl transferase WcaI
MNVLIVTNHFWPENFRVNDLAVGLVERGHQVSVITGVPNYPEGRFFPGYGIFKKLKEEYRGVRIRRIPLVPRGSGSSLWLMINYLTSAVSFCLHAPFVCREKYDVIFVFETSPATIGLPAVLLKKLRKTPVVFWVLDLWPESISATGALSNSLVLKSVSGLMRWIYKNCDRILASSKGFESNICKVLGYERQVDYFPNWVEPEPEIGLQETQNLSLPTLPEGFRVIFTGNVGAAQDFETILEAASLLKNQTDLQWIIVGDGRRLEWVRDEVKRRNLEKCVHCLGRYPSHAMPWFYAKADLLLMPLKDEPIFRLTAPGKLQSYMASGRPILASLNGEGESLVRDAACGMCARASDPKSLADTLVKLKNLSASERNQMGENGKRYSEEHFCRSMLFDRVENVLKDVVLQSKQNRKRLKVDEQ